MMCIELLENGKSGKVQRNIDLPSSYFTYPLVTRKNVNGTSCNGDDQGKRLIEAPTQCRGDMYLLPCFSAFKQLNTLSTILQNFVSVENQTESCNGEEIFEMKLFIAQDAVYYSIQHQLLRCLINCYFLSGVHSGSAAEILET